MVHIFVRLKIYKDCIYKDLENVIVFLNTLIFIKFTLTPDYHYTQRILYIKNYILLTELPWIYTVYETLYLYQTYSKSLWQIKIVAKKLPCFVQKNIVFIRAFCITSSHHITHLCEKTPWWCYSLLKMSRLSHCFQFATTGLCNRGLLIFLACEKNKWLWAGFNPFL